MSGVSRIAQEKKVRWEKLVKALMDGDMIFNGHAYISYSDEVDLGFLSCEGGCCDITFDGMDDVKNYLGSGINILIWDVCEDDDDGNPI